jgi:excisionase family DNA binding protein
VRSRCSTSLLGLRRGSQASCRSAQVAAILQVSPKTVARWAQQGRLPCQRTLGGHRRYPEPAIRELAASLRQEVRPL